MLFIEFKELVSVKLLIYEQYLRQILIMKILSIKTKVMLP